MPKGRASEPQSLSRPRRRGAGVRTYLGQPVRAIVERLQYGVRRPGAAVQSIGTQSGGAEQSGALAPHSIAGTKRLALLREATITAGMRGTRVLQAACDCSLAGTHLADGTLVISPGLCDALIELMQHLPIDLGPTDGEAA